MFENAPSIAIIGLGYVGLPLAVAVARHYRTTGFDISAARIAELRSGFDRTNEIDGDRLKASTLAVTDDIAAIGNHDVYIVTVPTPVDLENTPDLTPVLKACATVGKAMGKGAVVVFESTVYPGVTEDICGPELEKHSGMKAGVDFFLGYSPERINPGDREHTVDRITKVIAGENSEITELLAQIYGKVTTGGVFKAASIRAAEAAKVIENSQRDINIAFINEITMIFQKLGLSIYDVLEASATKWNFLKFTPGLVGGHCIGVDPFYLSTCSMLNGHNPEVILAGRRINDRMGGWIGARISEGLAPRSRVLILGLTFKENVPDLRNSKVVDVIAALRQRGHIVDIHDPYADEVEAQHEYGETLLPSIDGLPPYDCVVGAVSHEPYAAMSDADLQKLVGENGLIADIKGMWRNKPLPAKRRYWSL